MEIRVNLIPENKKEEIRRAGMIKISIFLEISILAMMVIFFTALFLYNYILDININSMEKQAESSVDAGEYKKIRKLDEEFSLANVKMSKIIEIDASQFYWSELLKGLSRITDDGVAVTDLSTKNLAVFIAGVSRDRENLIDFKEKLEREDCFEQVNLPLSNFVSKDNVGFQIDFKIKENCLKKR